MNKTGLIQGLIFVLVVSLAIAGVYAGTAEETAHDDATNDVDGLFISGSGDVSHVPGYTHSHGDAPHIETMTLHI